MELNDNIKNNILSLRKERGITQDVLAAALDISVQAVSKWETGISLPDIMQLPRIAQFFGVTIDYLFYSESITQATQIVELPDDDVYRVIQCKGSKLLDVDIWDKDKYIMLKIPETVTKQINEKMNFEIWGNANINGNIGGYVECQGTLNCGNIEGYAECEKGINCGNIGSYAECKGDINCGNIHSYVESEGSVNCGSVGGDVHCKEIRGDFHCNGTIVYEK
jgi:transcriptional regulator with XRE-family HTH domain